MSLFVHCLPALFLSLLSFYSFPVPLLWHLSYTTYSSFDVSLNLQFHSYRLKLKNKQTNEKTGMNYKKKITGENAWKAQCFGNSIAAVVTVSGRLAF